MNEYRHTDAMRRLRRLLPDQKRADAFRSVVKSV